MKWFLVNEQRDAQILFYVFISIYNSTCHDFNILINFTIYNTKFFKI